MRGLVCAVVVATGCSSQSVETEGDVAEPAAVIATARTKVQAPPAETRSATEATVPVVSLPALVGRSRADVAKVLGEPDDQCEKTKYGPKCTYRDGAVEIVFIRRKADWFTIELPGFAVDPASLAALDLEPLPPTSAQAEIGMWWDTIPGIRELRMVPGSPLTGGRRAIWYVHAKARTK